MFARAFKCSRSKAVRAASMSTVAARVPLRTASLGAASLVFACVGLGCYGFQKKTAMCSTADVDAPPSALSPKEFRDFKVAETKKLSHDTVWIRVALPSEDHVLGLSVASCLSISADIDGQTVGRPYTPISHREQKGYADFVVKSYPARTDGQPGGMGKHLFEIKAGQSIAMKGPWKKLDITPNKYNKIGMIAGGTGLTPMLQVVKAILSNPEDRTSVTLLYGNKTEDDILLRQELTDLSKDSRFRVVYTLDRAPSGWGGEAGFVTDSMVKKTMPSPGEGTMIMVCGPEPMMSSVCGPKGAKGVQGELGGVLKVAGYGDGQWYKF